MECDKLLPNSNEVREIDIRRTMTERSHNVDDGTGTVRLILQFPEEAQDTVFIQKEVKEILISELREQVKNLSYSIEGSDCR